MAAWTNLINSLFAVSKPITSSQGIALRDNPIAIAEGASASPVVRAGWHPHDSATANATSGIIYNHALTGNFTTLLSPVFADGYEYRFLIFGVSHNDGVTARDFQIEVQRVSDSAYVALGTSLTGVVASANVSLTLDLPMPRIAFRYHVFGDIGAESKINRVRFSWSGGAQNDAGVIIMQRRWDYTTGY